MGGGVLCKSVARHYSVEANAAVGRDGYYKVAVCVVARFKKRGRVDNGGGRPLLAEVLQKHIGARENILVSDSV